MLNAGKKDTARGRSTPDLRPKMQRDRSMSKPRKTDPKTLDEDREARKKKRDSPEITKSQNKGDAEKISSLTDNSHNKRTDEPSNRDLNTRK